MSCSIDIAGECYGRLTAVRALEERDQIGSVVWLCRCVCGESCTRAVAYLRQARKNGFDSCCSTCQQASRARRVWARRRTEYFRWLWETTGSLYPVEDLAESVCDFPRIPLVTHGLAGAA